MVSVGSGGSFYKNDPKVITLDEYGVLNFAKLLDQIKKQDNLFDRKNRNWFDVLPKTFLNYPDWFFLMDGDQLVAFSTVQEYYSGCYRVLTRTYVTRPYRRFVNPTFDQLKSPTMFILPHQLNMLDGYDTVFISMQGLQRREAIQGYSNKLQLQMNQTWKLCDGMVQTCDNLSSKDCWQNVIFYGKPPKLNLMSIERYNELWPIQQLQKQRD